LADEEKVPDEEKLTDDERKLVSVSPRFSPLA
jgi:hypothetical protein